jgi:hypothetical protein
MPVTSPVRALRSRRLVLLLVLALTAVLPSASGALTGGQEAPDGPVDGVQQAYTSGSLANGALVPSRDTGYDGEHVSVQAVPIGRQAIEPTVAVDSKGTAFMTAAAYDLVQPAGGVYVRTKLLRSTDDGISWESVEPTLPAGVSGQGETSLPPATFDPYVYIDEDTDRVFSIDLVALACSWLQFSDDAGETWTSNPAACGQMVNDHQTIVTGPPPPGIETLGYPNVLYYCFNRVADASCSRSLDGGLTFTPAGSPAFLGYDPQAGGLCGGLHGHIRTDNEGRLYLPKGHCQRPWLAMSEDGGQTWTRTLVSEEIRAAGAHLAVATDDEGNVYYLWWDPVHRLPWLAVSTDHGATFGEPMMIAPPGVAEVNFPSIAAGEEGGVVVHFPGTTVTDRSDQGRPWNTYLVVTTDALADEPTFLSTTANPLDDPIHRGNCQNRCGRMLDFLDVKVSPADGTFWAAAVDTCTDMNSCRTTANAPANDYQGIAVRQLAGPRLRSVPADG